MIPFTRLLAVFVLLCLALSWKLWLSNRVYPLVPVFDLVPAFPHPFDRVVLALVCAFLIGIVLRPRSKPLIGLVLAAFAVLFLQDQGRMWPSFYEFCFMFLLLFAYRRNGGEDEAQRILAGIRFVLAAVYFWGGLQKLTPRFFYDEFPWFLRPLTDALPIDVSYLPALGVCAAVFETTFAIGLLTARFRTIARYEAMLMHALIFFLIGPIRHDWNNSSWMWSVAMAVQTWVAFSRAPAFRFRTMFGAPFVSSIPQALAVVFIGSMPVFNNANRWDSALSFNVYTGNVNYAQLRMSPEATRHLPAQLSAYIYERDGWAILDPTAWTEQEFNPNPYPEQRIFRAVLDRICSYVPDRSVELLVYRKSGWWIPESTDRHGCGTKPSGSRLLRERPRFAAPANAGVHWSIDSAPIGRPARRAKRERRQSPIDERPGGGRTMHRPGPRKPTDRHDRDGGNAMAFTLTSPAIGHGQTIPKKYTCDGADVSIPLTWIDPPGGTQSLALIADDPDAPVGDWVHWVLYDLPAQTRELPEGVPGDKTLPDGSKQGKNDFGRFGYGGPCPPKGRPHRYVFTLYAVDRTLDLAPGATKAQLLKTLKGRTLGEAQWMAQYGR